ncbi:MAG: ATP-dependent Clp protease ATP-binding subunit [Bacteroidales bacterium]|jgi:ATP-dependent Clp protease ATP-binding subunit ClpC|nr:ATP-dependent Clp protease ATP-binding subunit [Bacteroidales bacterium]
MEIKYTPHAQNVINNAKDEAIRLNNSNVAVEHLFLAMLREKDCRAMEILKQARIDTDWLKSKLEYYCTNVASDLGIAVRDPQYEAQLREILGNASLEAFEGRDEVVGTEHLLLSILAQAKNSQIAMLLGEYELTYDKAKTTLYQLKKSNAENKSNDNRTINIGDVSAMIFGVISEAGKNIKELDLNDLKKHASTRFGNKKDYGETPFLDNFAKNLSKAAANGSIDMVVGRDKEIERITQILSRRKKNNPVLIGEPGVGKSAIVEGLALRINAGDIPNTLIGKKIYTLDLTSLVAGTKYRGEFEERIKRLINEVRNHQDIIIFIDEMHTIVGAGNAEGSLDASNIIKPALARGEIQCIGATTLTEYRKHIESDGALERRFQKVQIEATSEDETLYILQNIKEKYEIFHKVKYSEKALEACVRLTNRYITDRLLPDKAIDAMDEAGAMAHVKDTRINPRLKQIEEQIHQADKAINNLMIAHKYAEADTLRNTKTQLASDLTKENMLWEEELRLNPIVITEEDIAAVVSSSSGVSIKKMTDSEASRIIKMDSALKQIVIGQDEAIEKVTKTIRRSKAGLKDPNRPVGSFIFVGSTGVGKTLLAKSLAKYLFDSDNNLIRLDMSEYMEKHSISRLIGSPPGYVGYEEAGQLTEKVRNYPYSIVLFDEIEKAHADIYNILLQILDEGHLTDSLGRKVDFKNTIIIMTSNVGSRNLKDFGAGIGFSATNDKESQALLEKNIIDKDLKRTFSPEFLNRIDDVIFFNNIGEKEILKIIDIEFQSLKKKIAAIGYSLDIDEKVKHFIINKGCDLQYGARPLKRTIEREIEDCLSESIIANKRKKKRHIIISTDKDKTTLNINIE